MCVCVYHLHMFIVYKEFIKSDIYSFYVSALPENIGIILFTRVY